MKPSQFFLPALAVAVVLAFARWMFEMSVVSLDPDPQSGIWVMFSTVISLFIVVVLTPLVWLAMYGCTWPSVLWRLIAITPLLFMLVWLSTGVIQLARIRSALLDSINPNTSAQRLSELANFQGGPGYEIDNRVANHPNTPPDVLRSLHGRKDQDGTELCLARNPHTPDDVLISISKLDGDYITKYVHKELEENPRYRELMEASRK